MVEELSPPDRVVTEEGEADNDNDDITMSDEVGREQIEKGGGRDGEEDEGRRREEEEEVPEMISVKMKERERERRPEDGFGTATVGPAIRRVGLAATTTVWGQRGDLARTCRSARGRVYAWSAGTTSCHAVTQSRHAVTQSRQV